MNVGLNSGAWRPTSADSRRRRRDGDADLPKVQFAPLPLTAIGDKRLATIHLQILMAIAGHDRLSQSPDGRGVGCFASVKRLATLTGYHYTNVSTALNELIELGYVYKKNHPYYRRKFVFQINYSALPGRPLLWANEDFKALPKGTASLCPAKKVRVVDQRVDDDKYIPLKRIINKPEAGKEEATEEISSPNIQSPGTLAGAESLTHAADRKTLVMIAEGVNEGIEIDPVSMKVLGEIIARNGPSDPLAIRAKQLLDHDPFRPVPDVEPG